MAEANVLEKELAAAERRVELLRKAVDARKVFAELMSEDQSVAGLVLDSLPRGAQPAEARKGRGG